MAAILAAPTSVGGCVDSTFDAGLNGIDFDSPSGRVKTVQQEGTAHQAGCQDTCEREVSKTPKFLRFDMTPTFFGGSATKRMSVKNTFVHLDRSPTEDEDSPRSCVSAPSMICSSAATPCRSASAPSVSTYSGAASPANLQRSMIDSPVNTWSMSPYCSTPFSEGEPSFFSDPVGAVLPSIATDGAQMPTGFAQSAMPALSCQTSSSSTSTSSSEFDTSCTSFKVNYVKNTFIHIDVDKNMDDEEDVSFGLPIRSVSQPDLSFQGAPLLSAPATPIDMSQAEDSTNPSDAAVPRTKRHIMAVSFESYQRQQLPFHEYLAWLMKDVAAEKQCSYDPTSLIIYDKDGARITVAPSERHFPVTVEYCIAPLRARVGQNFAARARATDYEQEPVEDSSSTSGVVHGAHALLAVLQSARRAKKLQKSKQARRRRRAIPTVGAASRSHVGNEGISQLTSEEECCRMFCEIHRIYGSASTLLHDPAKCKSVIEKLREGCTFENHALLMWLSPAFKQLALSKFARAPDNDSSFIHPCHVAQTALEVASPENQDVLIAQIRNAESVVELYESPNGNFLLQKAIELFHLQQCPQKSSFVSKALLGKAVSVSKHKFGCRIIQHLIKYGEVGHICPLLDEIVAEAKSLSFDAHGKYVVECILEVEHMACRHAGVLSKLLPHFDKLARTRNGSIVAQRALSRCNSGECNQAAQVLLTNGLIDVACNKYGSFVVQQLAKLLRDDITDVLLNNVEQLRNFEHARKNVLPVLCWILDLHLGLPLL